jgi:hypothetical protein
VVSTRPSQERCGTEPASRFPARSRRQRRLDKVNQAGMIANLCVESHLRELLEQGFEVAW